jgi:hypothetical protein
LRERKVINPEGEKIVLKIHRLKCSGCLKIHHQLPDMIVPYKRHSTETILNIINNNDLYGCEENTVNRIKAWWAAIQLYINSVMSSLSSKYGIILSAEIKLPEIVRALVNSNLWPGTRSVLTPG